MLIAGLMVIQAIAIVSPVIFHDGIPSYLGWHNIMELASIVVSIMVFAVGWNNKNPKVSSTTIVISCSFLLVGLFDLLHTLSYVGMPDFITANSSQKHLTFWLFARVIGAGALFIAALKNWGPLINYRMLATISFINTFVIGISLSLLVLLHSDLFPVWFVQGKGLTDPKKFIEYFVIALHLLSAILFVNQIRNGGAKKTVLLMFSATTILALGEIFFSLYTTMVGGYNVLGHVYKVIAYLFIYKALVAQAFDDPYRELEESNVRISQLINYDVLTGLPNRQLLRDRVEQAIKLSSRTDHSFALFFIDIDNFKNVNDTMGHVCGDELLKEISHRLTATVRAHDTVARVGGDEFVVLVQKVNENSASVVANNIIEELSKPHVINNKTIISTPSIGIAVYWNDGKDFETLYQHADTAMYIAKNKGKNSFAFFTQEIQSRLEKHIDIESQLRTAITNNELCLYYQPQISLKDNSLIGAEALIRWHSPNLGIVSPGEFIPIAEKTGQILEIGEWVMRTAVDQIKLWEYTGLAPGVISINISAVQFNNNMLAERIFATLAESNISTAKLGIELTESVAMNIGPNVFNVMDKLHNKGIKLSIDDFGTGYSSLSLLKKFNIAKLKIDQSFIRDILTDDSDKAIVQAIIKMATSLGFRTIAEGVELHGQALLLSKLGCDEMQGYVVSKPLPVHQFEQFVRNYKS